MRVYIIMPAHNEQAHIKTTLLSITKQTQQPDRLIVVNDNSTDATAELINSFTEKYNWIQTINLESTNTHQPGSKIIHAFYAGLNELNNQYDVICKFDADIVLPENYIEVLCSTFRDNKVGMAGGHLYILKKNTWVYEPIADKNHIRGPIKAYRKSCFEAIGGLKAEVGWDTIDVLLANYYNWKTVTLPQLKVKHLKPTGVNYTATKSEIHGYALYKMRYGFALTILTALKVAYKRKQILLFFTYISGYFKAFKQNAHFLVSEKEGRFIRNYRWRAILKKLF